MQHFYHLTLRVAPGGSRKRDEWIAGTLAEITEFLHSDLASGQGAYHAICYGETMELECWQGRTLVGTFDLHPCIEFTIEGYEDQPIWFEDGLPVGYDDEAEEEFDEEQRLYYRLCAEELKIDVRIDWSRIALPALAGEPLRPGESAVIVDPKYGPRTMAYGHHMRWG